MRRALAVLLVAFLLASCAPGDTIVVTEADSLQEIRLDSSEVLEIRLESNPTTGFRWVVGAVTLPEGSRLVEEDFEEPDSSLVGAPGTQVFVFEASKKGAGTIRLDYIRPFDDPPIPDRVVEYIVLVDGAQWSPGGATPPGTSRASTP